MLSACSLHGQHELHTRDQAAFLAAMLVAIAGSEAAVRSGTRPRWSTAPWRRWSTTGQCSTRTSTSATSTCRSPCCPCRWPDHGPREPAGQHRALQRRGTVVGRRVPARSPGPAAPVRERGGVDGLPQRGVPGGDAGGRARVRRPDHDGPPLRPAHDEHRDHHRRARGRPRDHAREAGHHAAPAVGRRGHHRGLRGDPTATRPSCWSRSWWTTRSPTWPAAGGRRRWTRWCRAVRRRCRGGPGRQLPGPAVHPRGLAERRIP